MFWGKQDILMPDMYFIVSKCNSILCKNDKKKHVRKSQFVLKDF
jgi:hypothetical protein